MKLLKQSDIQSIEKQKPTDWFSFIIDDCVRLVVPVGPRFQVDVPSWSLPPSKTGLAVGDSESDNSKWLGTQIWPVKGRNRKVDFTLAGKGRPETCECPFQGSVECVRWHIFNKKFQLQIDLGPAFWKWKFDSMGEDVSKQWNSEEQKKFESIVKTNSMLQGRNFIKSALECFPCQTRESIVSYYLNVYLPRRIRAQTRLGGLNVDTDDDSEGIPPLKGSRKRFQAYSLTSTNPKHVKTTYLRACR
ncbi:AT-rich interactive domain-containing protein 2-like [Sesamum indicum]|uniref:AT-rich interactive domain-containing protein 2-like n=1 Tax=Sesamum indicum TaxID=4182 RepID=A0A6I9TDJ9_SESIN|nr:AT-rich interactive domain-containing protein 2-like [Sesamum indicum]XP_011080846.1 AT-rich interactive domain-containing protein 2-like [Sesamum indicum]